MKLFNLPGFERLGTAHRAGVLGLSYEAVRVERGRQTDPAYLAIRRIRAKKRPFITAWRMGQIDQTLGTIFLWLNCSILKMEQLWSGHRDFVDDKS
jgi:hypothetical protein